MNASNQTAMVTRNSTVKALGNVNFRPLGVCSASVVRLSVDTMLPPPSWRSPLHRHECYPRYAERVTMPAGQSSSPVGQFASPAHHGRTDLGDRVPRRHTSTVVTLRGSTSPGAVTVRRSVGAVGRSPRGARRGARRRPASTRATVRPTTRATNGWQADRAHDAASRSMGQDMQRGPPRPRPSSPPAIVTISMPLRRRNVLVVAFRS